jgi:inorganic triphosphatase YgiF
MHIIGQEPLQPLFKLEQIRVVRLLQQETHPVARLSIDSVTVADDDRASVFHVLEVELLPANSEEQLTAIVECLQDKWYLQPEPYCKFERTLALLDAPDGKAGGRFSL